MLRRVSSLLGCSIFTLLLVGGDRVDAFGVRISSLKPHLNNQLLPSQARQYNNYDNNDFSQGRWETGGANSIPSLHHQRKTPMLRSFSSHQVANNDGFNSRPPQQAGINLQLPGIYGLTLLQIGVFLMDHVMGNLFVKRNLYLWSQATRRFQLWQPLTACFCHRKDPIHLVSNLFLMLLFGRSVQAKHGKKGLLASFVLCGVASNLVPLLAFPGQRTARVGAAGAALGLFLLSSWDQMLSLRSKNHNTTGKAPGLAGLELLIMGAFVTRQFVEEVSTTAFGGKIAKSMTATRLVAHFAGVAAGACLSRWALRNGAPTMRRQQHAQQQHVQHHSRTTRLPNFFGAGPATPVDAAPDIVVPETMHVQQRFSGVRQPMRPSRESTTLQRFERGLSRRTPEVGGGSIVPDESGGGVVFSDGSFLSNAGSGLMGTGNGSLQHGSQNQLTNPVRQNGQRHCNEDAFSLGQTEFGKANKALHRKGPKIHYNKTYLNGQEVAASVTPDGRINYGMNVGMRLEPEKKWWDTDLTKYEDCE